MPVMGFDDERVRDAYWAWAGEARLRGTWDWQAALRAALVEMERQEAERAAVWLRLRQALEELAAAFVEAWRPVVEALAALGEAAIEALGEVWELIGVVEERRPAVVPRPRHENCRCLPVERVDPVRAGRTRWWTRK